MNAAAWHEVAPGFWVRQSRAFAMNSLVVLGTDGALVVDPGVTAPEIQEIRAFLDERSIRATTLVITHSHWDHVLGINAFPEARLVAHAGFPAHLAEQIERGGMAETLDRAAAAFEANWDEPRFPARSPDLLASPTDVTPLDGWDALLVPVPGHAPDQLALFFPGARVVFAADILSDLEIPFIHDGDLTVYLHTLERLEMLFGEHGILHLIPGHGAVARGWPAIHARLHRDRRYLQALDECITPVVAAGGDEAAAEAACADVPLLPAMEQEHRGNVQRHFAQRQQGR